MSTFDENAFVGCLGAWVREVDNPELNRAWEIVIRCIKAHASCDREEGQSKRVAVREAWADWAEVFLEELSTYTMVGMFHEFHAMCPLELQEDGTFDQVFREAIRLGRGLPAEVHREPGGDPPPRPRFTVIRGGRE